MSRSEQTTKKYLKWLNVFQHILYFQYISSSFTELATHRFIPVMYFRLQRIQTNCLIESFSFNLKWSSEMVAFQRKRKTFSFSSFLKEKVFSTFTLFSVESDSCMPKTRLCRKLNVSWLACKICFFVSLFAHCFDTLKSCFF